MPVVVAVDVVCLFVFCPVPFALAVSLPNVVQAGHRRGVVISRVVISRVDISRPTFPRSRVVRECRDDDWEEGTQTGARGGGVGGEQRLTVGARGRGGGGVAEKRGGGTDGGGGGVIRDGRGQHKKGGGGRVAETEGRGRGDKRCEHVVGGSGVVGIVCL